jgi:hypothetical protein
MSPVPAVLSGSSPSGGPARTATHPINYARDGEALAALRRLSMVIWLPVAL